MCFLGHVFSWTLLEKGPHSQNFPGTGDIFASVLLGKLLRTQSFEDSCAYAADFIATVIRESAKIPTPVRDGVALENHLWRLCQ